TLPRGRAQVRGRACEAMEDGIAHGLFGAGKGRVELAEAKGVVEDDRLEHGGMGVRRALVGEERTPGLGGDAVTQDGGELALLAGEVGRSRVVAEGGGDRVLRRVVLDRGDGGRWWFGGGIEQGARRFEERGRGGA